MCIARQAGLGRCARGPGAERMAEAIGPTADGGRIPSRMSTVRPPPVRHRELVTCFDPALYLRRVSSPPLEHQPVLTHGARGTTSLHIGFTHVVRSTWERVSTTSMSIAAARLTPVKSRLSGRTLCSEANALPSGRVHGRTRTHHYTELRCTKLSGCAMLRNQEETLP